MELRSLKIDVLLPDSSRFHVLAHTLNCSFEDLLNVFVRIGAQKRLVVLQEGQIALPKVDLAGVVTQRAFEDFRGFFDGLVLGALSCAAVIGTLGCWVSLTIPALDKKGDVCRHVLCIDGVFVTDLLEHLHVLFVRTCALAGLSLVKGDKLARCRSLRSFDLHFPFGRLSR